MFPILIAVAATLFVVRLGGAGQSWLPSAGSLALLLLAVHVAAATRWTTRLRDWREILERHRFGLVLAAIVVLAFMVRFPGYAADLGHVPLDIDEHRLAANVRHYFTTGELDHRTVEHYPGVVFWLLAAASFIKYFMRLSAGAVLAPDTLPVELFAQAARAANIWVAGATVAMTGLLGRRVSGPAAGLLAAALIAIAPLSIEVTTLVRNDAGMVLAVVATVLTALVLHSTRRIGWAVTAGALAGIATGIKYSSVFVIVPVLIAAIAEGTARERLRRALVAFAAFVLAVAISNHFVWSDFPTFLRQLADQIAITGRTHYAATDNPAAFHVAILSRFGVGWPLLLLAAGFIIYALTTRRAGMWIFITFPVLYMWLMTQRPSQFPRWVYPLLPFVCIAGAAALIAVAGVLFRAAPAFPRRARLLAQAAVAVLIAIFLWPPVWAGAVSFSRRVTTPTHTQVERWMAERVAPGTVVLLGNGWLTLPRTLFEVRRVENLTVPLDSGVDALAATGADLVVVPEPWFGHPTLRRLGFLQRFHASRGFGGRQGYDYEIYVIPKR